MIKFLLIFAFPYVLFAALTFSSNNKKDIDLLKSFDVDPSFLYDEKLNEMKSSERAKYQFKHFFKTMDDAYIFIPRVKEVLNEYNVPAEFLYLAMAESDFSSRAYSVKSATGIWQFMPRTAKLYSLRIDDYVDERRDLIKSSKAAAKYLTYLHNKFGKWYLAAIAYNCGGGRLSRAIKKAGTDDLKVLLDEKKKYIPLESRLYIRKILALALVGNDEDYLIANEYEFLLNRGNAYSLATVKVARGESLTRVSKVIGIPTDELKKLNHHLTYDFTPPNVKTYDIYIPYVKLSEFKQNYHPENANNIYMVHVVKKGDSLRAIGKKYKVSYKIIKDFNKLKTNRLSLKQRLVIPIAASNKTTSNKKYYRVKNGDTLYSIAKANEVSISFIKSKNNLKTDSLKIGDKLYLND